MNLVVASTSVSAVLACATLGGGYAVCRRRSTSGSTARALCFATGLAAWLAVAVDPFATVAVQWFWARAVQVVVLLYLAPLCLALGAPLTVVRDALTPTARTRLTRALASRALRGLCAPPVTSAAMLALPWLLYLTGWYAAALTNPAVGVATTVVLPVVGFAYFYARLQVDPVPRRYTPLLAIGISAVESLADGVLGLVLWLGPVIATEYYGALHRSGGPDPRTDQTLGAGILWLLGDVLGIPFLLVLLRALGRHERAQAQRVDAALDAERGVADSTSTEGTALWWEQDPHLRERFRR